MKFPLNQSNQIEKSSFFHLYLCTCVWIVCNLTVIPSSYAETFFFYFINKKLCTAPCFTQFVPISAEFHHSNHEKSLMGDTYSGSVSVTHSSLIPESFCDWKIFKFASIIDLFVNENRVRKWKIFNLRGIFWSKLRKKTLRIGSLNQSESNEGSFQHIHASLKRQFSSHKTSPWRDTYQEFFSKFQGKSKTQRTYTPTWVRQVIMADQPIWCS